MQAIIESGDIVLIMLMVVAVEAIALILYFRRTGRGVQPLSLLLNLGAGGSLMLALGAALKGFGWSITAALLVLSGVFHLADLSRRWR